MIKLRTYKEKNKLLFIGLVLFSFLAYWLSIDKTVSLYSENKNLEARLDSVQSAPIAIARFSSQLKRYEKSLNQFSTKGKGWEEHLLQGISKVCQQYQVTLINFPAPQVEGHNDYVILTREVKVEGTYLNLVQVLYELERMGVLGRITSTRYVLEEDRKTRKTSLFAYIYIQHMEKEVNHEM